MKYIKLPNGIILSSLDAMQGRVRMLSPLAAADIRPDEKLVERLKDPGLVSQWSQQSKNDNFDFSKIDDVMPRDGDYIQVNFRALSKTLVPGHWIDWTKDNVLEESTQLLAGATVYANHDFWDINGWLGAVSGVEWDAAGKNTGGVPGINAQYKIDALMNPRIARGLMMTPPAIHSTSMTVLFEFEYSHPDMAAEDRWKFFKNLGEEIDGEIVRLIVTKINEYWEASLVFQGADRLAKMQPADDEEEYDSFSADGKVIKNLRSEISDTAAEIPPPNSNEEKTMKLTNEQKRSLGIEFDGEDVPEAELLKAAESLAAKAANVPENLTELNAHAEAGRKFTELQRTKVMSQAKLAELGADEGELDEVIVSQINAADFDTLVKLESFYDKKVAQRFPKGRSSQEPEVPGAGDEEQEKDNIPEVSTL